jgi:O-antigen ligase
MHSEEQRSKATVDSTLWIGVVAITPVYRLIQADYTALLPYAVLALLGASVAMGRLARPPAPAVWIASLGVIPMAALVSGTSTSVVQSLSVGIKLALLVGLTPFVLCYYVRRDPLFLRRAVIAFLTVQTLSSMVGLVQLSGVVVLGRGANQGRANGLAAHPNVLGMMAVIAIVACVGLLKTKETTRRSTIVGVLAVNAAALVATGSLSSMLSLGVALVVQLLCMRITFKAVFIMVLTAAVVGVGLMAVGVGPTSLADGVVHRVNVVTGASDDGVASLDVRERTYDFALGSIDSDPLTGVGMDQTNEGTYDGKTVVHNFLLRSWYQGGLLLLGAVVAMTVALLRIVVSSILHGRSGIPAAIITSIITFAATSAFYDQQQYWLPLLFAVAMTMPKAPVTQADRPMVDAR